MLASVAAVIAGLILAAYDRMWASQFASDCLFIFYCLLFCPLVTRERGTTRLLFRLKERILEGCQSHTGRDTNFRWFILVRIWLSSARWVLPTIQSMWFGFLE
jgi:hypothetical protein